MTVPAIAIVQVMNIVGPLLVAVLYIVACSFFKEPNRRNFNAIMIAGAGAAYLNGGLAYGGLRSRLWLPTAPIRACTRIAS